MDELWDIERTAAYLGVTERTVYNKVRSGSLPAVKVGRLWRVRPSELEAWLAGSRTGRAADPGAAMPIAAEPGAIPARAELEAELAQLSDALERRLVFVGMLTRGVEALGWPAPVVVGGHAVEFYTGGGYTTVDIDLVGASEPLTQVLGAWGFTRQGRHWYDEALGLVVEAPGGQLEAQQSARALVLRAGRLDIHVLGIEDLIIDRLAACVHWNDAESCAWAARLLRVAENLDEEYLMRRAREEDVVAALDRAMAEAGLS